MYEKLKYYLNKLENPQKLPIAVVGRDAFICTTLLKKNGECKYIQYAFPNNCMLDLKLLNNPIDLNFVAESPEKISKYVKSLNLLDIETLMPLPNIYNARFMADIKNLTTPYVYIQSESEGFVYKVKTAILAQIYADFYTKRLTKPVEVNGIDFLVDSADEINLKKSVENITHRRIEERLVDELNIPPLPVSFRQLVKLKNSDKKITIKNLLDIIHTDPVLSSQVLRWANSPFYSIGKKINSVADAISKVLGVEVALDLLIGMSLTKHLKLPKRGIHGYNRFWYDSLRRAIFVNDLAETIQDEDVHPGLAYTAGLLYNYGYLIVAEIFPSYFNLYCLYQEANLHLPHMQIERYLFGIVREQMASYLFNVWELPLEFQIAIRQQYNSNYSGKHSKYANLLYLANAVLDTETDYAYSKYAPQNIYENLNLTNEQVFLAKSRLEDYNDEFFSSIFSV